MNGTLPPSQPPGGNGHHSQRPLRSCPERPAVLITDDDAALRETLRATLEPCGVETMLAADGMEALEIVRRGPIHVAVFDMHMPRLTGLETMLRLRAMGLQLPCILISARLDEAIRVAANRAEAFSLLPKPVSRSALTGSVERALRSCYGWPG
jgi:CheY-like chemotaxis protein